MLAEKRKKKNAFVKSHPATLLPISAQILEQPRQNAGLKCKNPKQGLCSYCNLYFKTTIEFLAQVKTIFYKKSLFLQYL